MKKNTQRQLVFVMKSSAGAAVTGITPTCQVAKDGGAFAACTNSPAEMANGWYKITLTATELNADAVSFKATGTGAIQFDQAIYPDVSTPDDVYTRLGAPAGASVSADVASIKTDTGTTLPGRLPTALVSGRIDASVGAVAANAITAAAIAPDAIGASELAADAVTEIQSGLMLASSYSAPPSAATISSTVWAETTRALTDKAGFALSSAGVQAIWDALTSSLTTTGSIGKRIVDNLDTTVSSRGTGTALDAAGVQSALTAQGYTTARAGYLDTLNGLVAAIWANGTRSLTTFGTLATDVWAAATRTLTAGTNIVLAKGTGVTGLNDLDAAGVRAAMGLNTANLDTQLSGINTKTTNLPASPAAVGSAMTLDLTQAIPTSNTAQTLGDALNAARAQGFGKWVLSGTTLTLYAADGTTTVRTFTLDSASSPTSRT